MSTPFWANKRDPYEQDYQAAVGVIGGPQRAPEEQMWQGLRAQQAGMAAAANRRGLSGGLARAGQMAGAELGSRGYGLAEQLRAADAQSRMRDQLAAAQARSAIEGDVMGLERQAYLEAAAEREFRAQQAKAKQDAMIQSGEDAITGTLQGTAQAAGALSDRRVKRDAYLAGRRDQDDLVRSLGAALDREDATGAWRGGRPGGDARAAQLGAELDRLDATGEWRGGVIGPQRHAATGDTRAAQLGAELDRLDATGAWRGDPQRRAQDARAAQLGAELARENDATTRALEGYRYHYRDPSQPGAAPGPQYGVMAQDLERTPLGRTMVVDTPAGKAIDGRAATGATLGMIGRLGERLSRLEEGR